MTMFSFRIEDAEAARVVEWAKRLDIDRSELLRVALRRHLDALAAGLEAVRWADDPDHEEAVAALGSIADWGPNEDWSDWADAEG
jgi:predicted transcriptional regulator